MKVLCSSVLGMEILVVLLATSLATSTGAVSNVRLAWGVGSGLTPPLSDTPGCSASARVGRGLGPTGQAMVTAPRMVGSAA